MRTGIHRMLQMGKLAAGIFSVFRWRVKTKLPESNPPGVMAIKFMFRASCYSVQFVPSPLREYKAINNNFLLINSVSRSHFACSCLGWKLFHAISFLYNEREWSILYNPLWSLLPAPQTQNYWSLISMWLMDPFVLLQAKRSNTEISIPALGVSPNIGLVLVEKNYERKLSIFRKTGSFQGVAFQSMNFPIALGCRNFCYLCIDLCSLLFWTVQVLSNCWVLCLNPFCKPFYPPFFLSPSLQHVHVTTGMTLPWSNSLSTSPWVTRFSWPACPLPRASCPPTLPAMSLAGEGCRVSTWVFAKAWNKKKKLLGVPSALRLMAKIVDGAQDPLKTQCRELVCYIRPHFTHIIIFPFQVYFPFNRAGNAPEHLLSF